MHKKQLSEAQQSLKKEHWWGSVTQTMFFYTWILGCSCPKAVSAAACAKGCRPAQWSLATVQDLQCENVNFIGQGCLQRWSCCLGIAVQGGKSMRTYAKYNKQIKWWTTTYVKFGRRTMEVWQQCLCHRYRLVSPPCIWIIWTWQHCSTSRPNASSHTVTPAETLLWQSAWPELILRPSNNMQDGLFRTRCVRWHIQVMLKKKKPLSNTGTSLCLQWGHKPITAQYVLLFMCHIWGDLSKRCYFF